MFETTQMSHVRCLRLHAGTVAWACTDACSVHSCTALATCANVCLMRRPEDAEAGGKADLQGGFTFVAANDKIIAGRGLGGGMALWASTKPSWQLSKGIDL